MKPYYFTKNVPEYSGGLGSSIYNSDDWTNKLFNTDELMKSSISSYDNSSYSGANFGAEFDNELENAAGSFAPLTSVPGGTVTPGGTSTGVNVPGVTIPGAGANKDVPWYKDGDAMKGYAGLASAFVSLAALPSQIKMANLQAKALKQNMATAKEEQDRRNKNISSFNAAGRNRLTSAFA